MYVLKNGSRYWSLMDNGWTEEQHSATRFPDKIDLASLSWLFGSLTGVRFVKLVHRRTAASV